MQTATAVTYAASSIAHPFFQCNQNCAVFGARRPGPEWALIASADGSGLVGSGRGAVSIGPAGGAAAGGARRRSGLFADRPIALAGPRNPAHPPAAVPPAGR